MVVRDLLEKVDECVTIEIIAHDTEVGGCSYVFVGPKCNIPRGILGREVQSIDTAVLEWLPYPLTDIDKAVIIIAINADTADDDEEETVTKGEGSC